MTVFILAGGESSRMGEYDKPHLQFYQDKTILGFIIDNLITDFEVKVIAKDKEEFSNYNVEVLTDLKDAGPLGGIYTGLKTTSSEYNFFLGCDMPFVSPKLISWMFARVKKTNQDGLVPIAGDFYEPLFAIYRKTCLKPVEKVIADKNWPIISFYEYIDLDFIQKKRLKKVDSFEELFFNINTYADYLKAKNEILPKYLNKWRN
ncbi:MAG: molybdenum cofactor guanylyltransferase [Halarsenatibacteraceae bacterium]